MLDKSRIEHTKNAVLARFKMDETTLKASLKFKAIIIMCSSTRFLSAVQIINDLCSSADGTLLGPKRKSAADPQVVEVIMTNPDLVYADQWPQPRFGPKSLTLMIKAIFKENNGYELHCHQYGKPTYESYKYTHDVVKEKAREQGVSLSNIYMIGDNPESDIAGGNACGWTTILVKSGVFKPTAKHPNDPKHPATHVVDDFSKAIELIYRLENLN